MRRVSGRTLAYLGLSRSGFEEFYRCYGWSPCKQYLQQRRGAYRRGVGWAITFPQWWDVWQKSGKYAERGRGREQYVMARHWDAGPYSPHNVDIQHPRDNLRTLSDRRRFHKPHITRSVWKEVMGWRGRDPLEVLLNEEEEAA